MPRCCRAGAARRRSIAPCWRATPRPASPSCRWTRGSTPGRCCSTRPLTIGARRTAERCTTGWPPSAPRRSSRPSPKARPGGWRPSHSRRTGVTYAAKIRKEEALIDWTAGADAIDRQVRAFNPWPVAETRWQDRQLRVWAAEPVSAAAGAPGQVVEAAGGRIVVAAGEGALLLTRVQLAGRRAMTAAEFLNAHSLAGARLG